MKHVLQVSPLLLPTHHIHNWAHIRLHPEHFLQIELPLLILQWCAHHWCEIVHFQFLILKWRFLYQQGLFLSLLNEWRHVFALLLDSKGWPAVPQPRQMLLLLRWNRGAAFIHIFRFSYHGELIQLFLEVGRLSGTLFLVLLVVAVSANEIIGRTLQTLVAQEVREDYTLFADDSLRPVKYALLRWEGVLVSRVLPFGDYFGDLELVFVRGEDLVELVTFLAEEVAVVVILVIADQLSFIHIALAMLLLLPTSGIIQHTHIRPL